MNWVQKLLNYYFSNARSFPWRNTKDAYAIWISEIMLQQTRTETVISYYLRFMERFPDVYALSSCSDDELFKAWEGLGYYSRARNIKKAAKIIVEQYGGKFPDGHDDILSLPGIGLYTAGAISSIAFSSPYPAVDGNVLRVYSRLFADPIDTADQRSKQKVDAFLSKWIPKDQPGMFNQAFMDIGATICLPNGVPKCELCPLSCDCKAHIAGDELSYPLKKQKKSRRHICKTVFVLCSEYGILVYKREEDGVLKGLFQLPDAEGHLSAEGALSYLHSKGIQTHGELLQYTRKHIFTHLEWNMCVYRSNVSFEKLPDGWIVLSDDDNAVPTAYRKCINPS